VEGGGWRVEGGGWRVEGEGWRVEGGGWRVEGGGWGLERGGVKLRKGREEGGREEGGEREERKVPTGDKISDQALLLVQNHFKLSLIRTHSRNARFTSQSLILLFRGIMPSHSPRTHALLKTSLNRLCSRKIWTKLFVPSVGRKYTSTTRRWKLTKFQCTYAVFAAITQGVP
jgi:hypothetical protein